MQASSANYSKSEISVGTVAELFAGVGGFRLGLAKAGLRTIFSNQWEPSTKRQHASSCYVSHFGQDGHYCGDIATVSVDVETGDSRRFPTDVDLIVGGFPCQDYSVAKTLGAAHGLKGKKGVLWWEIARLIEESRPQFIFLENVDRLLKSPSTQRGRDFAVMLKSLDDLGYWVEWRVVNSADYGYPQRRKRVFIVAGRDSPKLRNDHEFAEHRMFSSGVLARALPIKNNDAGLEEIELSRDLLSVSDDFGRGATRSVFRSAGFLSRGRVFSVDVIADYQGRISVLNDVLEHHSRVPASYWISESSWKEWQYLKGAKSIDRVHRASGSAYRYQEGSMSFPDDRAKPSRTILTGEGGAGPSRFKHVIAIGSRHRRLLPVELERLNGFPDGWTEFDEGGNRISDNRRAFLMGNALVVGLIEQVGQVLANELAESKTKTA
jgi:DNA (cytosine-5)-methyltransferase 1